MNISMNIDKNMATAIDMNLVVGVEMAIVIAKYIVCIIKSAVENRRRKQDQSLRFDSLTVPFVLSTS